MPETYHDEGKGLLYKAYKTKHFIRVEVLKYKDPKSIGLGCEPFRFFEVNRKDVEPPIRKLDYWIRQAMFAVANGEKHFGKVKLLPHWEGTKQ